MCRGGRPSSSPPRRWAACRGYWWSPDGDRVAACRVDITNVDRWHLTDPADPSVTPNELAYPAAGTTNADVVLAVIGLDGETKYLGWDRETYPYLVSVQWNEGEPLTFLVQSRDQRSTQVLAADTASLATRVVADDRDPEWVELVPGSPAWAGERFVMAADRDGVRRVLVDGTPITPTELAGTRDRVGRRRQRARRRQQRERADRAAGDAGRVRRNGHERDLRARGAQRGERQAGPSWCARRRSRLRPAPWVSRDGKNEGDIRSLAESPLVEPNVELLCVGPRKLWAALLLPRFREPDRKYPVLLDPYGGPAPPAGDEGAATRSSRRSGSPTRASPCSSTDGRGTPGRGLDVGARGPPRPRRAGARRPGRRAARSSPREHPELDLDRVAIRGWSFGGYLAALAVLRRPDVFHAAVAGAPVTEWRLYDTHYTERYLGDPKDERRRRTTAASLLGDRARACGARCC